MSMATETFQLHADTPFDFVHTCTAHGWAALPPFTWDDATQKLVRAERLPDGTHVVLHMRGIPHGVHVTVESAGPLTPSQRAACERVVRTCLRLDEDLRPFYARIAEHPEWRAFPQGGGRLLRSPTLFEDIVKTICTTNTRWAQTKRMVQRLVEAFGERPTFAPHTPTFPTAQALAHASDEALKACGLGYRADAVREIARAVAEGALDIEAWRTSEAPTAELRKRLLSLRGIGPYAAATLLMLIGRYDEVPFDSIYRDFVVRTFFKGEPPPSKADLQRVYDEWGEWKYLAYWFDPRWKDA